MVQLFNLYKRLIPFFIFLCIVVLLQSPEIQKKPIQAISLPVGTAVYTLQLGTETILRGIKSLWNGYVHLTDVQKENKVLRQTISKLKGENNRLRENMILAGRLKILLGYQEHSQLDMIAAAVVGRKPSQWVDTMTINKGEQDGIQVDMGVVVPHGVVGKVIQTGPHFARVLLASDRNSAIGAIVQRTREEGIAQGNNLGSIQLKYLPHDAQIVVGDTLITSGMEGSFAKGLEIGQVEAVSLNEEKMFLNVRVTLAVDLGQVEDVLIIQSIENRP